MKPAIASEMRYSSSPVRRLFDDFGRGFMVSTFGSTSVENSTNPTLFSASGLDFGGASGLVLISVSSTYN